MKTTFNGPLAAEMARHLEIRQALGLASPGTAYTLQSLDRYLAEQHPAARTITRPIVAAWLETTRALAPRTRTQQLADVRQFCRYLFQLEPTTWLPTGDLLPPGNVLRRPYIYTQEEVQGLRRLAQQLPPAGSLRSGTYATLIGLLWVTGLRISEALQLNLADVDLAQGLLTLSQTKNNKARYVPLTASTVAALRAYLVQREQAGHLSAPSAAFFVNERGRRCHSRTVQATFQTLARQLALSNSQGRTPRLHDFRHTFATRTLADCYANGQEPAVYLPVLATYLGHVNLAATEVYLHPAPDLLATAGVRFQAHVAQVSAHLPGGTHENH